MQFTLFVILPITNDVCTLRHVKHGTTIREIRGRLEIEAGLPAQIYGLHNSDGQYLHEEHCLLLDQNVWDGFVVRVQLFDSWSRLYDDVINDRVKSVLKNGAVRLDANMATDVTEREKLENVIQEKGSVALYVAAFRGLYEMSRCLLNVGVNPNGRTPFARCPLYAAIFKDNDVILDLLVHTKAEIDIKDRNGDSPTTFSKRIGAKLCYRKLRLYRLEKRGLKPINGLVKNISVNIPSNRKLKVQLEGNIKSGKHLPRPPTASKVKEDKVASVSISKQGPRGLKSKEPVRSPSKNNNDKDHVSQHIALDPRDPYARPSSQCFVWDIDDKSKRRIGVEYRLPTAQDDKRTKSAKHVVRWRDESEPIAERTVPNDKYRYKSAQPVTILKNRSENMEKRSNLIRTLSSESLESNSSTIKSENALSQPDSELTLVSAPEEGNHSHSFDTRSVESAPATSSIIKIPNASSGLSRTKGSVRLLPFRRKQSERNSSAKRQIKIAEEQKRQQKNLRKSETFEQWLERKRLQECRERLTSQSEESSNESDSGNSNAYDDWMKRRGRRKLNATHHMTVEDLYRIKDRPLRGTVTVGNAQIADTVQEPESPDNNLRAYQKWKEKGNQKRKPRDPEVLKALVERKRQELLAAAVTYEDWLEHAEEKKRLMQYILQADLKELERIEEENLIKRSPRQISFDKWNVSVNRRQTRDKRRQEEERRIVEEKEASKTKSSYSVTHEVWLERKKQTLKSKPKDEPFPHSPRTEQDKAFSSWIKRKELQDQIEVNETIKGRELLKLPRNNKDLSVPSTT